MASANSRQSSLAHISKNAPGGIVYSVRSIARKQFSAKHIALKAKVAEVKQDFETYYKGYIAGDKPNEWKDMTDIEKNIIQHAMEYNVNSSIGGGIIINRITLNIDKSNDTEKSTGVYYTVIPNLWRSLYKPVISYINDGYLIDNQTAEIKRFIFRKTQPSDKHNDVPVVITNIEVGGKKIYPTIQDFIDALDMSSDSITNKSIPLNKPVKQEDYYKIKSQKTSHKGGAGRKTRKARKARKMRSY